VVTGGKTEGRNIRTANSTDKALVNHFESFGFHKNTVAKKLSGVVSYRVGGILKLQSYPAAMGVSSAWVYFPS
jgi:hypothetical protein